MAQSGVSLQVIGAILNHTHPGVTEVYARLKEDQARKALEDFGAQLVAEVGRFPSGGADSG
jgi:hypothetical protein